MGIHEDMVEAFDEKVVRPFYLFELETEEGDLLLSSTPYNLSWDSKTWVGNGWFRGLSSIKSNEGMNNNTMEIALAGANQSLISLALNSFKQSNKGLICLGLFDGSGSIIPNPTPIFVGFFSKYQIRDTAAESIMSIILESEVAKIYQPSNIRYTAEAQKHMFPTDKGLEYVAGLPDLKLLFGGQ